MGAFKYIRDSFEKTFKTRSDAYRKRLRLWNKQPSITRVEKPSNPLRAHALGYKAKREYIIVRVKTKRGKRARPRPDLGRKPAKNRVRENPGKPWRWTAEQKAKRKFQNMTLVNSYFAGEDGAGQYYEVIMRNDHDSTPKRVMKKAKA